MEQPNGSLGNFGDKPTFRPKDRAQAISKKLDNMNTEPVLFGDSRSEINTSIIPPSDNLNIT